MTRTRWTATFVGIIAVSAALALAGGSENKGKFNFKKTCKPCHTKGTPGGEVTPLTKTQEQWQRYFKTGTHNKGTEKLTVVMPAEQLVDVQTFLVNHAADSPQPETCGG
jgi:cytochrome c5